jgi:hypothetical protein
MDQIRQRQASRNAETRDGWNRFTPHRDCVMQFVVPDESISETPRRLCVLGAGNCNDLALDRIANCFTHIDLVDIDGVALAEGVRQQNAVTDRLKVTGQLKLHGDIDVTGIADILALWSPDSLPTDEQVDACIASARSFKLPFEVGSYSVVASVCLLSQLIEAITLAVSETHARALDLITTVRREHLLKLMELAKPGGRLILITDIVSSVTCPQLTTASENALPAIVGDAISQRNFFTGVNPFVIQRLLETDSAFALGLSDVRLSNPWVWDLGPRLYAVCALTARRV